MIDNVIAWSLRNRGVVLLLTVFLIGAGLYAVSKTPLDAIPDLSDVQVIIKTSYPGQAPQVVEDQVTYPLTTTMMAVPGARTVRGNSFFGDSYVYILFEDGTDLYWARSRVLEYLNQVSGRLPAAARVAIGPDATGVGWIYQYALVDRTGTHDLAQRRSLQDWFLKYELPSIPGVAEAAAIGGLVKLYQVVVDPRRLRAYRLPLATVQEAIRRANQEAGGSVIEMGEAEYMVRATGYLSSEDDLRRVPLGVNERGTPILLGEIADVRLGPEMRRGIAELNGEGEVAGGVVILRWGKDVMSTIDAVKAFSFDGRFGIGLGTLVLVANAVLLGAFTFGCNSFRHLVGGGSDCFSCERFGAAKQAAWKGVTVLNERHMLWAWISMYWVGLSDLYVRLCAAGVISDPRLI